MKNIGKRIYELRKVNRLTQNQLGKIAGVDGTNISRIENNCAIPNATFLRNIADYFHISCDYLVGRTPSETRASLDCLLDCSLTTEKEDCTQREMDNFSLTEKLQLLLMFEQLNEKNRLELLEILKIKLHMQEKMQEQMQNELQKKAKVTQTNEIYKEITCGSKEPSNLH